MMFVFGLALSTKRLVTQLHGHTRTHTQREEDTAPQQNTQTATLWKQKLLPVSDPNSFTASCRFVYRPYWKWIVWGMRVAGLPLLWWGREAVAASHAQLPKPREMLRRWTGSHKVTGMLESLHSSAAAERRVWFHWCVWCGKQLIIIWKTKSKMWSKSEVWLTCKAV